jgi:hypothetical protein
MDKDRDKSEFNSAVAYLNRINALFLQSDEAAINLDMYTWLHSLMAITRELSTEMTVTEKEEMRLKLISMSNKVNNYVMRLNKGQAQQLDQAVYFELHDYEMELRHIMKESGLQQKIIDKPGEALR